MNNEKWDISSSFIIKIATLFSSLYGVRSFKKQKEYEKYEASFNEFYIPLLKLIEKHLYVTNYNTQSFLAAKTSIHQLMEDKYIYVPFDIQIAFRDFEDTANEKNYKKFCDCFISNYCEVSRICGMKHISVRHRNKNNWYSSKYKQIFANLKYYFDCAYYILIVITIWLVLMAIIFAFFKWIEIM